MMNKIRMLFAPVLIIIFISCSDNKSKTSNDTEQTGIRPELQDTTAVSPITRLPDSLTPNSNPDTNGTGLKKEDAALQHSAPQLPAVKSYLKELKSSWKNTPNPIIATYQGNDFGDYQHILFKDTKGNTFDFGQAANQYGKYQLHEPSGQYEDNPAFLGKKFKVYWDWKLTDFLCCEGEYEKAKGYLPTITKLELIKY